MSWMKIYGLFMKSDSKHVHSTSHLICKWKFHWCNDLQLEKIKSVKKENQWEWSFSCLAVAHIESIIQRKWNHLVLWQSSNLKVYMLSFFYYYWRFRSYLKTWPLRTIQCTKSICKNCVVSHDSLCDCDQHTVLEIHLSRWYSSFHAVPFMQWNSPHPYFYFFFFFSPLLYFVQFCSSLLLPALF